MKWTELVTLMDAEATRMEAENSHCAAILMRAGAEEIRAARAPAVIIHVNASTSARVADVSRQIIEEAIRPYDQRRR